ncbi:DUF6261 family protein [Streptococcus saliviloxodontae]|uniref:Hemagglutinin n=1 Tax=Streptococcus saliviloxodontae TaxID=1349416 RepID=A0ABS2PL61_9STRE|nr:DUF6261 family protein [Streptococcus saliviloxodontae]MBM7635725.1 hypothetical protein [Streptococcus saliviloxodontae]
MNLKTYGIDTLATDHLKSDELSQLSADTAQAVLTYVKNHKNELLLTTHATNLQTAQTDFQVVQKGKVASDLAKDLDEADKKRDRAYQTFANFVKSYAYVDGKDIETAYKQLTQVLSEHKNITGLTYEEETAQLTRFFEEMAAPEKTTALATLNLTVHYDNLKAAQTQFTKAYQARLKEQTDTKVGASLKQKRLLKTNYDYLIDLVAVLAYGQPSNEELQNLKAQLNTIRKRYKG